MPKYVFMTRGGWFCANVDKDGVVYDTKMIGSYGSTAHVNYNMELSTDYVKLSGMDSSSVVNLLYVYVIY